ncbi:MAG: GTP 3',8-cyclase MoaA [Chloroflexota bacterium]|nr:GTP 3',8-cyclase MoaA [Chloroflexota bacterium]
MAHLDAYNRPISYLRISVTDRCNLRCIYCMPAEGVAWRPHDQILRYEEIEMVARAAAELGISKIRLTGGEPLVRLGIVDLVRGIASIPGIDDLAMTTNGVLLSKVADDLARAGLHRVNISLDTLNADRFRQITRCGDLSDVLAGIEAACRVGLRPIKINTVVIRGMNDDEVVDLAAKTLEAEWWNVRFIELMPVGNGELVDAAWEKRVVTGREVRERIETALGELEPAKISIGSGPARYHRLPGAKGTIGFITPISEHFCYKCNRLRLTADGQLRPCLLSDQEIDMRGPLRRGATVEELKALIVEGIHRKPMRHHLSNHVHPADRAMSEIGG